MTNNYQCLTPRNRVETPRSLLTTPENYKPSPRIAKKTIFPPSYSVKTATPRVPREEIVTEIQQEHERRIRNRQSIEDLKVRVTEYLRIFSDSRYSPEERKSALEKLKLIEAAEYGEMDLDSSFSELEDPYQTSPNKSLTAQSTRHKPFVPSRFKNIKQTENTPRKEVEAKRAAMKAKDMKIAKPGKFSQHLDSTPRSARGSRDLNSSFNKGSILKHKMSSPT